MNDENWQKLLEKITALDSSAQVYDEDLDQGYCDVVEFSNERGRFKLVRENRPVVLDKKMHYSHRQGDSARTEYVLSETELSHKLAFYREDRMGEWQEMDLSDIDLSRL